MRVLQNAVEPMQVDAPPEDNDNNEETFYLVENPTIDLEAYANSYTGLAKIFRLIFIVDHCPSLRLEALKIAISYVTTTYNVNLYQVIFALRICRISLIITISLGLTSTSSRFNKQHECPRRSSPVSISRHSKY